MFKIINITNLDGSVKKDTKNTFYSKMIGEEFISVWDFEIGRAVNFEKEGYGEGGFLTTPLKDIVYRDGIIKLTTINTIYTLEEAL
jgi:hypothetical protein